MTRDRLVSRSSSPHAASASARTAQPVVGKQTLTSALAPALAAASTGAAVQRRAASAGPAAGPDAIHAAAGHGTSGPATALPHLSRIQALFGRHDVGGVRAHVGGRAAEGAARMGAEAFAVGDQVAFSSAPDLHTAAHEAAHVVQQRGGVQLKGGVGVEGDVYEQHADQVADLVVAGRSAEALLDRHAAPGPASPAQLVGTSAAGVQAKWLKHAQSPFLRWDSLVNGLRWYIDPESGNSFFQIETDPGVAEAQLLKLESLEGPSKARTIEEWCQTPLFEPSTRKESTAIEPSPQNLGPTTARGVPIPRVGFGTDIELTEKEKQSTKDGSKERHEAQKKKEYTTLMNALGTGYTLFDTAREYGTLDSLGQAIRDSRVPPQDVFVVYKIKPSEVLDDFAGSLAKAVGQALDQLGRPYLDVLMLHDMNATEEQLADLTLQMKALVGKGVVRYLGLSNVATPAQLDFCARQGTRKVGISFVQNKMHPHRQDEQMRAECDKRGITYMGYSIMGSGNNTGKCGHVVSSEPAYDVRQDESLDKLSHSEDIQGGGPALAISWAVQSGTVQIPKTSDPRRMVENRRAGRQQLDPSTMKQIHAMDDVITDDDQAELLQHTDRPINQIKLAIPNKTHWKALDRMYDGNLGGTLDAIAIGLARKEVVTALTQLIAYVEMIDDGLTATPEFVQEFKAKYQPGNYSRIAEAFSKGPPITILLNWWSNAHRAGGCVRARSRVLGYIANDMDPASDFAFDQHDEEAQVAKGLDKVVELELGELGETYPVDLSEAEPDDTCYGKYQGKKISFEVVELAGSKVKIKITGQL
jgi:diketogulonate reductase-like aldo/keto reductase